MERTHHKIDQNSPEWLRYRLGLFTSSNIYLLLTDPKSKAAKEAGELSQTALGLVQTKACDLLYGTPDFSGSSFSTEWGHEHETTARLAYEQVTGNETQSGGFWTFGDDSGSSPDALVGDDGLLEIKCPYNRKNHFDNLQLKSGLDLLKSSKQYYYQVHHQLYVTGRQWCDFVSFDPRLLEHEEHYNKAIHITRIYKDDTICAEFEKRIKVAAEMRDYILKSCLI